MMRARGLCLLCALVVSTTQVASGAPIYSRSAFDAIPFTLVDFETRGDGTPYGLPEGGVDTLDPNQYSAMGFAIDADGVTANVDDASFENALSQIGSPQHSVLLTGGSSDEVGFVFFGNNIYSAGISIIRNTAFLSGGPLVLRVYTRPSPGEPVRLFEEAIFDSDFIQGGFGAFDYGFIGISSNEPIVSFVFDFAQNDDVAIHYDDLIFSTHQIPAPAGVIVVATGAICAMTRRRP